MFSYIQAGHPVCQRWQCAGGSAAAHGIARTSQATVSGRMRTARRRSSLRMRSSSRYNESMSREFHPHRPPVGVLDYEIAQEQAAALGRMGRALERALARLREFDALPHADAATPARQARRRLVAEAGHALWMFVVQREACGLRDSRAAMHNYNVPGEVQQRRGAVFNRPLDVS